MRSFAEVLSSCGGQVKLALMLDSLRTTWHSIVRPGLSQRTRPAAYDGGVLIVSCSSPSAETAMKMEKRGVLLALKRLGYPIDDIKIVKGGSFQERPIEVRPSPIRRRTKPARDQVDQRSLLEAMEKFKGLIDDREVLLAISRLAVLAGPRNPSDTLTPDI